MLENIKDKIDNTIECYEHSITEENERFVRGVIYGLIIAKASIEGVAKHEDSYSCL